MKTIVIFSLENDFHTKSVVEEIERAQGECITLTQEGLGVTWSGSWTINSNNVGGFIDLEDRSLPFEDIGAVFVRRAVTVETPGIDRELDPTELYIATQNSIHINSLLRLLETTHPVMNTSQANLTASSKVLQLQEAQNVGLATPDSCAAGGPVHVKQFFSGRDLGERVCIKALEAIHLREPAGKVYAHYTTLIDEPTNDEVSSLKKCPAIFQSYIEKDIEVRATVVGDQIFAASIDTRNANEKAKVDWRHYDWAQTPYYQIELPKGLQEKLICLMRNLGLSFGAIDLIRDLNGEYIFLEVNSQGQWLWIEELTNLPISQHIAQWLIRRSG